MKKQWNKIAFMSAIVAMFTFASCNRTKDTEPKMDAENAQSFEDNTYSENEFDAITDIEQGVSEHEFAGRPANGEKGDKDGINDILPTCATKTVTAWSPAGSNIVGKKIVLDFGTTGCTSVDGKRVYKGKIISYHAKKFNAPAAIMRTEFDGFFVKRANQPDSKYAQLVATKVVVNESAVSTSNPNITIAPFKHRVRVFGANTPEYTADSYAKLVFSDGKSIDWNTNRVRTWAEGGSTPFTLADDIFLVSGSHKGKNINGTTYQAQTIEGSPLQFKFVCWALGVYRPTKGKLQIASSNHPTVVLDFGDGSCDNNFTVTQ
ncbi:MAG: hypothetical protein EAZ95_17560 [Bacteroidetes bacterium]|nr:MAG: hypothetical protein EAZ95_17560 [Bacteroidota bacterium]